jgi:predicted acylesterase/phospholipase RssA
MSLLFRKLALGGGGVKGILHIGALQELSKFQSLHFPDGVYGSSVGSIIATYVAFELPVEKMIPLIKKYLSYDKIVPKPDITHISNCLSAKGIFPMDLFETTLKEMFLEVGLNIEGKTLNDAKMPLFIVSSNITKRIPSVISGDVPLITALKCSCCLPAVFRPQELYGSLYIDGDVFSPCISNIVPVDDETLVISLLKQNGDSMTPKNIDKISPFDYIGNLYLMVMVQLYKAQERPNILGLRYPGLYSTSKLDELDLENIMKYSANELNSFLTKRGFEKSSE